MLAGGEGVRARSVLKRNVNVISGYTEGTETLTKSRKLFLKFICHHFATMERGQAAKYRVHIL